MVNIEKRHTKAQCPRSEYGYYGRPDNIIHHWWNLPSLAGSLDSTVDFFVNAVMRLPLAQRTSAHYVVSGTRVVELVDPTQAAFHSGSTAGNGRGIGIEIDPRMPGQTLETVAQLCAHLEKRFGPMKHTGHRDWSSTQCPGDVYPRIPWIINRTNQILAGGGGAPTAPVVAGLILPCEGARITQNYGDKATGYNVTGHTGTDFAVNVGTPVKAIGDGTVLWADWAANLSGRSWENRWYLVDGAGIVVVIDHGEFLSVYAHLNSTPLNTGNRVSRGQELGKSGSTGNSTGPHLHFEVIPKPFAWNNTYRGEGGYYGRVDPVAFVKNRQAVVNATAVQPTETKEKRFVMVDMSKKELEDTMRAQFSAVLNSEPLRREGSVNGKPVGGTTTFGLEARYNAQNFGQLLAEVKALKADVLWAQKQIAELKGGK